MKVYGVDAHEEVQDYYNDQNVNVEPSTTKYRIGGGIVGGAIGYKVGSRAAKNDPIISQQRKKKLIGTIVGAAIGQEVGHIYGKYRNQKNKLKTVQTPEPELLPQPARRQRLQRKVDPNLRAAPESPTSPSGNDQVNKFQQRYGRFFKK